MKSLSFCMKVFKLMLILWVAILIGMAIAVIAGVTVTTADIGFLGGATAMSIVYTFILLKIAQRRETYWKKFLEQFENKKNKYVSSDGSFLLMTYGLSVLATVALMIYYIKDRMV